MAPRKTFPRFAELQADALAWQVRNFGETPAWQQLLGIVEELGEFIEAGDSASEKDAIADFFIFACQFSSVQGWSLDEVLDPPRMIVAQESLVPVYALQGRSLPGAILIAVGKLAHAHLKMHQRIRKNEDHTATAKKALRELCCIMRDFAHSRAYDLQGCITETWARVSLRDFTKERAAKLGYDATMALLDQPVYVAPDGKSATFPRTGEPIGTLIGVDLAVPGSDQTVVTVRSAVAPPTTVELTGDGKIIRNGVVLNPPSSAELADDSPGPAESGALSLGFDPLSYEGA